MIKNFRVIKAYNNSTNMRWPSAFLPTRSPATVAS